MLKVMKPGQVLPSDDVVMIPDASSVPDQAMELSQLYSGDSSKLQEVYEELTRKAEEDGKRVSEGLLERAKREREDILDQARQEAFSIREQARKDGYAEGLRQRSDEIDSALGQLQDTLLRMAEEQDSFLKTYAKNLNLLAVEIAGKVLQAKIQEDDLILTDMVKKALSTVKDADWISVEISSQMPKLVECLRRDMAEHQGEYSVGRIEITPSPGKPGSCLIQAEDRVIDASVSTQLENMLHIFEEMG